MREGYVLVGGGGGGNRKDANLFADTIELEAESTQYVTKGHPANLSCTASFQDPRNSKNALAFKRSTPVAPSISPNSSKYNIDDKFRNRSLPGTSIVISLLL